VHTTSLLTKQMSTPSNSVGKLTEGKEALIEQAIEYLDQAENREALTRMYKAEADRYWKEVPKGPTYYYGAYEDQCRQRDARNEANARQYDDLTHRVEVEAREYEDLAYATCNKLDPVKLKTSGLKKRLDQRDQVLYDQISQCQMNAFRYRAQAHSAGHDPEFTAKICVHEIKTREFKDRVHEAEGRVHECEAEIAKLQCQLHQYQEQLLDYEKQVEQCEREASLLYKSSPEELVRESIQKAEESEKWEHALRERLYSPFPPK
jgi:hypothetical protein